MMVHVATTTRLFLFWRETTFLGEEESKDKTNNPIAAIQRRQWRVPTNTKHSPIPVPVHGRPLVRLRRCSSRDAKSITEQEAVTKER